MDVMVGTGEGESCGQCMHREEMSINEHGAGSAWIALSYSGYGSKLFCYYLSIISLL